MLRRQKKKLKMWMKKADLLFSSFLKLHIIVSDNFSQIVRQYIKLCDIEMKVSSNVILPYAFMLFLLKSSKFA